MKQQRFLSVLMAALLALGTVSAYAAAGGNGGGNGGGGGGRSWRRWLGRQCRRHVRRPHERRGVEQLERHARGRPRQGPVARGRPLRHDRRSRRHAAWPWPHARPCARPHDTRVDVHASFASPRVEPHALSAACKRDGRALRRPFFIVAIQRRCRAKTSCRPDLQPAVTAPPTGACTDCLHAVDRQEIGARRAHHERARPRRESR